MQRLGHQEQRAALRRADQPGAGVGGDRGAQREDPGAIAAVDQAARPAGREGGHGRIRRIGLGLPAVDRACLRHRGALPARERLQTRLIGVQHLRARQSGRIPARLAHRADQQLALAVAVQVGARMPPAAGRPARRSLRCASAPALAAAADNRHRPARRRPRWRRAGQQSDVHCAWDPRLYAAGRPAGRTPRALRDYSARRTGARAP